MILGVPKRKLGMHDKHNSRKGYLLHEMHHHHDIQESPDARHVRQQNCSAALLAVVREQNRFYQQQRRKRMTSEQATKSRERAKELAQLRIQNMTPAQHATRLERHRVTQRKRRLLRHKGSEGLNLQEKESARESVRERGCNCARQRRASLTIEQRQEQLARRRTNYHQRRLMFENPSRISHTERAHYTMVASTSHKYSGDTKKIKLARRCLRLNHMRHLARLLNSPINKPSGDTHRIGADAITKEIVTTSCRSRKRLRLTHLKCLARALNSTIKETADQNHLSETEVKQSLPRGEFQWMNGDVLKCAIKQ